MATKHYRESWELAFWTVMAATCLFWAVVGYAIAVLVTERGG